MPQASYAEKPSATGFTPSSIDLCRQAERVLGLIDMKVRRDRGVHEFQIQDLIHDEVAAMPGPVATAVAHMGYDRLQHWRLVTTASVGMNGLTNIVELIRKDEFLDEATKASRIEAVLKDLIGSPHMREPGDLPFGYKATLHDGTDVSVETAPHEGRLHRVMTLVSPKRGGSIVPLYAL